MDYGSYPRSREEMEIWFQPFVEMGLQEAQKNSSNSEKARKILAKAFRGLWIRGFQDQCVECADILLKSSSWVNGWIEVKETLYYERDKIGKDDKKRLETLEHRLRPRNLQDRLEYYVSNDNFLIFDQGDHDSTFKKI